MFVFTFFFILFLVLTQEEWNEKQRAERKSEFSWEYDSKPKHQNIKEEDDEDMIGPSLNMFSTQNNPNIQTTITSKSFNRLIYNELDNEPAFKAKSSFSINNDLESIPLPSEPKGAEIAPPPTYEYYGPSGSGSKISKNFINTEEMQDSISKGFENANNRTKSQKNIASVIIDE